MGRTVIGFANGEPVYFDQLPTMLADVKAVDQRNELREWQKFYTEISRKYGTPARPFGEREYVALYVAQDGRCAICRRARGRDPREPLAYAGRKVKPRRLGVDHNHFTGLVRGLLCAGSLSANTCNRLVARYDPEALVRAVNYLAHPPAVAVLFGPVVAAAQAEMDAKRMLPS
jgi:Recombination endonuclease VII